MVAKPRRTPATGSASEAGGGRAELLRAAIASVPDFPVPGIDFKDITPLLADGATFSLAIDELTARVTELAFGAVVAIESRGFLFGAPLASRLGCGFIPVRKGGKLPGETDVFAYTSEYCTGTLEARRGSVGAGGRYLIVDDLLATGGTARATADYVTGQGGTIAGFAFLVELDFLEGRDRLRQAPVVSVLRYGI